MFSTQRLTGRGIVVRKLRSPRESTPAIVAALHVGYNGTVRGDNIPRHLGPFPEVEVMRLLRFRSRSFPSPAAFAAVLVLLSLLGGCLQPTTAPTARLLELEDIYGRTARNFSGSYVRGLRWLPDGTHYLEVRNGLSMRVAAATGEAGPAYDYTAVQPALVHSGAFTAAEAYRFARRPTLHSADYEVLIFVHQGAIWRYDFADGLLLRLAEADPERELLTLSPDKQHLGFVHANDLYVLNMSHGSVKRLTHDGGDELYNGKLDWVYQEELYGRGNWRGYWWSEDGQTLAFLQLDERRVPVHTMVDHLPTPPELITLRYPKAGDANPVPRVGFVRPADGTLVWADLSAYDAENLLVLPPAWTPDGWFVAPMQDRTARWLELNLLHPGTGQRRVLVREEPPTAPAWVEHLGLPHWLPDGSFLWLSARDGWPHLYHYALDGTLRNRLTAGPWEVRDVKAVAHEAGWVYFSGTADTPIAEHLYRVPLAGGEIERLTAPGFHHSAVVAPQGQYFIDTFSNANTPPRVQLHTGTGALVRVLSDNPVTLLAEYDLPAPEFLRITVDNGRTLNAMILRPPGRAPGERAPVVHFVYGGPHIPTVHDRWGGSSGMFQRMLAQHGYLVWVLDPHSASGEGWQSAWLAADRLGVTELEDLEAGLRWLGAHEAADLERVCILGHSYGGYLTCYALSRSVMFKLGLAAAPLTDWRNYDTIYTERFLRTPQENPDGYKVSSAVVSAENLRGRLLIAHGMLDENVHVQSTLQVADQLQRAGKLFDLMIYPRCDHGLSSNGGHWLRLRWEYIRDHL